MILTSLTINILIVIGLMILAYLVGSIPFGLWVGKAITGIDVREHGSKNIGTTNCIRVLGKKVGFLIFFLDVFKGMFVILLVRFVFERFNILTLNIPHLVYGIAAILGHTFSIFLKFKGGKGVATSLGVVFILAPIPALTCLIVFGLVLVTTGYVCLCSCFAGLAVVAVGWILNYYGMDHGWILEKPGLVNCIFFSVVTLFIIIKHRTNFKRLINGTENCFKKKKKKNIEIEPSNIENETSTVEETNIEK